MQLVAVCERDDQRLHEVATTLGVVGYRDMDSFLDHAMDAVILVNDFDQHAPVAISALDRGLNVLSETADADPMGDGVAEILMLRDFASVVRHQRAPTRTCTSAWSCRSPASRRCVPAWPAACLWRFPTCAAERSAGPSRLMTGSPSCQSSSERSQSSRPQLRLGGAAAG